MFFSILMACGYPDHPDLVDGCNAMWYPGIFRTHEECVLSQIEHVSRLTLPEGVYAVSIQCVDLGAPEEESF